MDPHFLEEPGPNVMIRRDTFPPDETHPEPWTLVRANVARTVIWHSPSGFEFGFEGSGPADLALNVLQAFLPGREVDCFQGTKCSTAAQLLHQDFKRDVIAKLRSERTVIYEDTILRWIIDRLPQHAERLLGSDGVMKVEIINQAGIPAEHFANSVAELRGQLEEIDMGQDRPVQIVPLTMGNILNDGVEFLGQASKLLDGGNMEEAKARIKTLIQLFRIAKEARIEELRAPVQPGPLPGESYLEDLKEMVRLTGDFLRLTGHKVGDDDRSFPPHAGKAMTTLIEVCDLLSRLEDKLDIPRRQKTI